MTIWQRCCIIFKCDEPLAQQAEHLTFNQGVRRSNRRWLTNIGALEKRLNSPAFHAGIHGFESHTRHHIKKAHRQMGFFYMIHLIRRGFEVYALQGKSHTRHHIKNTHLMMSAFLFMIHLIQKGFKVYTL